MSQQWDDEDPQQRVMVKRVQRGQGQVQKMSTSNFAVKLDQLDALDYNRPDVPKAFDYGEKKSFRMVVDGKTKKIPFCAPISDLKFGAGLQLYFYFVKFWTISFFLLSIISIYQIELNYLSRGLEDVGLVNEETSSLNQFLLKASFGNVDAGVDIGYVHYYRFLDLGGLAAFILLAWLYRVTSNSKATTIEEESYTAGDYALYAHGFEKQGVTEAELMKHFSQYGKIIEVQLVYDFKGTLLDFQKIEKLRLKEKYEDALQRLDPKRNPRHLKKLRKKKKKAMKKLIEDSSVFDEYNINELEDFPSMGGAYVIFDDLKVEQDILKLYKELRRKNYWRYICCCFCCCYCCCCKNKVIPQKHLFRGNVLKLRANQDEPNNIKWENLDVGRIQFGFKKLVAILNIIICLALSLIVFFITNAVSPVSTCKIADGEAVPSQMAAKVLAGGAEWTFAKKQCFCMNMGAQYGIGNVQTTYPAVYEECGVLLAPIDLATIFPILQGIIIGIVNFFIQKRMLYMGEYQRFKSLSHESTSIMSSIFLAQYLNTAVIPFFVVFNFGKGVSTAIADIVKSAGAQDYISSSDDHNHGDVEREWYVGVGIKFQMTFLVAIFTTFFIKWFFACCYSCGQASRRKAAKNKKIHLDAKKVFVGPEFNLMAKYAMAMSIIWTCMTYSGGIPLLYPIGFFLLGSTYIAEKYSLIHHNSKMQAQIDQSINTQCCQWLPHIGVVHAIFSAFMYTAPGVLNGSDTVPSKLLELTGFQDAVTSEITAANEGFSFTRLTYGYALVFTVFIVGWIAVHVTYFVLTTVLGTIFCCCGGGDKEDMDAVEEDQGTYTEEREQIDNGGGGLSYDMLMNPKYKDLVASIIDVLEQRRHDK